MNVRDLADELAMLDPDQPVPTRLILDYLDVELSYIEDVVSSWLAIAEMFGRTMNPEIERFANELDRALSGA